MLWFCKRRRKPAVAILVITLFILREGRYISELMWGNGLSSALNSESLFKAERTYQNRDNQLYSDDTCVSKPGNTLVLHRSQQCFNSEDVESLEIITIAFLNTPGWIARTSDFSHCPVQTCRMAYGKRWVSTADAVVAHCPFGLGALDIPRSSPDQVWIMYGMEPPTKYRKHYKLKHWVGRFNWTMTYRLDSDIFNPYAYLIVTTPYKEQSDDELLKIVRKKHKSVAWFVGHCNAPSRRQRYVEELKKYVDVDIFGRCTNTTYYKKESQMVKLLNENYKFYLSFESSLCKDYVTEKFFKVFNTTTIPVVRGAVDYETLFPENTFINTAKFKSARELGLYLKHLIRNDMDYLKFLREKNKYSFEWHDRSRYEDARVRYGKYDWRCKLCEKLHHKYERKSYNNLQKWLWEDICFDADDILAHKNIKADDHS